MTLRSRLITGIVIVCSLGMLSSCAFPVRPGYDRRSGTYKRYRVPKQTTEEVASTAEDSQGELTQEEKLAAAGIKDTSDTSVQADSTTANADSSKTVNALAQKTADSTGTPKSAADTLQNRDSSKVVATNAEKKAEKKAEESKKKAGKTTSKTAKATPRPTNLEKYAKEWLGAKYVYGAANKRKTDCSGYVMQVYKGFYGISLDHSAQHMFDDGRGYYIKRKNLQEGDLVFFGNFWKISHVGIYLKGDRFIHASTSDGVIITSMDDKYWAAKYKGARRFK